MLEVELKASLAGIAPEQIQETAERMGFLFGKSLREIDIYFNGNDRDFFVTDEALRLRSCQDLSKDAAPSILLTYKGPKQDAVSSTRTEYETSVGNLDTAEKLLSALGYRPMYTVDKTRLEFTLGSVTLCLDTVAHLGSYLELEMLAEDENCREAAVQKLLNILDALKVSRGRLTQKSYLELLYA